MRMINLLEQATGREAKLDMRPMQPGDVKDTYADISAIERDHGYAPTTSIDEGFRALSTGTRAITASAEEYS
jgi:UDP-glucuronate 4-epimerase